MCWSVVNELCCSSALGARRPSSTVWSNLRAARAGPRSRRRHGACGGRDAHKLHLLRLRPTFALGSELRCADCGGHLGDVFNDGKAFRGTPAFESGLRYCRCSSRRRRPGVPARGRRCTRVWRRPLQAALRAAGRRRAAVVAAAAKGERRSSNVGIISMP